eukprot:CAMPEP_0179482262 /NCGR_PEP_ID=MMETSP0799-20121207/59808_1 /TAXON_ID=46947 /ORGANISM="Geminigera cryophila, Strain CCMP2564" /LENGTH=86 /DNA_ID=CAMNT_0021295329 /DNA_START=67 /DNA_END=323 /DNA_ORIENTATION=-
MRMGDGFGSMLEEILFRDVCTSSQQAPCGSCLVVIHSIVKGSHLRIVDYIDVDAVLDEHVDDLCPSVYCREVDGCVCVFVDSIGIG